jgi:hypothetical protein
MTLENIAMMQYSVKEGLQVFGEARLQAVLTELQQLHDWKVIEPKSPKEMTKKQRKAALWYLMFLKQKHCGKIKGHRCADG